MKGTATASSSPMKIRPRKIGTTGKPLPEVPVVGAGVGTGVGVGGSGVGVAAGVGAAGLASGTTVVKTVEEYR